MSRIRPARPAVFLDKDGTLMENVPYNVDPARMLLVPGAIEALLRLSDLGWELVIITNQSGVGRGIYSLQDALDARRHVIHILASAGVRLGGYYFCPHFPGGKDRTHGISCTCRKPAPGLLLRAAAELDLDLSRSWMIGDILDDVEAGARAGCRTILIDNGNETEWLDGRFRRPDRIVEDFASAADVVSLAEAESDRSPLPPTLRRRGPGRARALPKGPSR